MFRFFLKDSSVAAENWVSYAVGEVCECHLS